MSTILNDEMLKQVQHDNGDEFSITLDSFQGRMNTDTCVFDDGLWDVSLRIERDSLANP
jgi:hypothetical protein